MRDIRKPVITRKPEGVADLRGQTTHEWFFKDAGDWVEPLWEPTEADKEMLHGCGIDYL